MFKRKEKFIKLFASELAKAFLEELIHLKDDLDKIIIDLEKRR
jgi:hypothetical protein